MKRYIVAALCWVDNRRIVFNAPPGTYTFYCQIPGHRQAGMQGTITIH